MRLTVENGLAMGISSPECPHYLMPGLFLLLEKRFFHLIRRIAVSVSMPNVHIRLRGSSLLTNALAFWYHFLA